MNRALFFVVLAAGLAPAAADAVELMSHRAVYALDLGRSRGGSVAGLDGRLVLEWNDNCEGSTVTQRIVYRLTDSEGTGSVSDFVTSNWESADGTSFRFASHQTVDGEPQDDSTGSAELDAPGKGGRANFSSPTGKRVALDPGTVFPAFFTREIVGAALQGGHVVDRLVFDGSADVDFYHAIAYISPRQPPGKAKAVAGGGGRSVAEQPSWIVSIGYYKLDDEEAGLPDYEISFRMFPNGVSGDLVIDYGDFSITGRLTRLERLPKSKCRE